MVRVVLPVVVVDDGLERGLLALGVVPVVLFLLREVLLDLPHVLVALSRRREDGGDLERDELRVGGAFGLELLEDFVIFDGVVDRGGGQQRVEASVSGRGIVFVENGLGDRLLGGRPAGLEGGGIFGRVVIDVEAQNVPVLDRVGDGVGVELFLEQVRGGSKGGGVSVRSA